MSVTNLPLPATAAHIHAGAADVNGPVVVPFSAPDSSGTTQGCTIADATLVEQILADPSGYYVNVHTSEFPGGAIRGQLEGPPRVGDRLFIAQALYASDASALQGNHLGQLVVQCTFGLANTLQCDAVAALDGLGQIHVGALIVGGTSPFELALLGGTGQFADVGGDGTATDQPPVAGQPDRTLYELRIQHL